MHLGQSICVLAAALRFALGVTTLPTSVDDVDISDRSMHIKDDHKSFTGITHEYNISRWRAYAGHFHRNVLEQLKASADVATVEPDQLYTAAGITSQTDAPYNLNLISHRSTDRRAQAEGDLDLHMDSGININHREFQMRASNGYNALASAEMKDTFGHGTHVAAIAGGRTFGVAKKTRLIAVKVMRAKSRQAKAVVNLSMSGEFNQALSTAIDEAFNRGVTTVVAHGNRNQGSAWPRSAIVVSGTDKNRRWARPSERSARTTIFAPGVSIRSAWIRSVDATKSMSGSSFAAANLSSLVAYLKSMRRLPDSRQTQQTLIALAIPNVVKDAGHAPNLFSYNGCGR
ncbi:subtilisin-like protein [Myriangium duriaei CBS 260.36]|uniref:Subtilisin-like protein n=1 Tax=Myriangium duriaei CBS 260.36 TaxID=1168546 RepID=A0A9P4MNT3_9PEZI|nr:subtilisin-like protein [Myriangium duriaei CBS 260.36]